MSNENTLVVFDFDGTLFKSPYKPENWKGAWWSNIKSLTPPLVPEIPGDEWWNKEICEKVLFHLSEVGSRTIILTGRIDRVFNKRVNDLLQQKSFNFSYVGLAKLSTSIDSKFQHLDEILSSNPHFKKIIFYDDRIEHFPLFEEYCVKKKIECEVIQVAEAYTLLNTNSTNEFSKNKVYVLIGPPGVGKTTYVKSNFALRESIIISRDSIVERVAEESGYTYTQMFGNSPELKELNDRINKELSKNIEDASMSGKDVVVDMTNMNVKSRASVLNKFPKDKFTKIALDFTPNKSNFDGLMKSNDMRNKELKKNGKDKEISRDVLSMMFDRYESPKEEEGFDRITKIDINARLRNL